MYLKELLKYVAKLEGIPESKIIWDEVEWFEGSHEGHGTYKLCLNEDETKKIESITVECDPTNLINPDECQHYNSPCVELGGSIIYQRGKKTKEIDLQRKRREGKLAEVLDL